MGIKETGRKRHRRTATVHAMTAKMGSGGIFPFILNLGTTCSFVPTAVGWVCPTAGIKDLKHRNITYTYQGSSPGPSSS
jgi:hypothetical protein